MFFMQIIPITKELDSFHHARQFDFGPLILNNICELYRMNFQRCYMNGNTSSASSVKSNDNDLPGFNMSKVAYYRSQYCHTHDTFRIYISIKTDTFQLFFIVEILLYQFFL